MKPHVTSDCSLAPKLLFVDWLIILANEKQAVQFRSPIVLVCEQAHHPNFWKFIDIYRITKTRFHSTCLEDSSPLYADQA